jgi:hypothetical protein
MDRIDLFSSRVTQLAFTLQTPRSDRWFPCLLPLRRPHTNLSPFRASMNPLIYLPILRPTLLTLSRRLRLHQMTTLGSGADSPNAHQSIYNIPTSQVRVSPSQSIPLSMMNNSQPLANLRSFSVARAFLPNLSLIYPKKPHPPRYRRVNNCLGRNSSPM